MYLTVNELCNRPSYQPLWSGLAAFAANFNAFAGRVEIIQTLAKVQSTPREGITAEKAKVAGWLVDSTLEVAGAVKAYATVGNNLELLAKVDFSRTDMERLRDTETDDRAQLVHDVATKNLGSLGDYGITQLKLDNLQGRIDAYAAVVQSPRTARAEGRSITESLAESFRVADGILKNVLDPLMLQFKAGNPEFYAAYQAARVIIDQPGTHESPEETPAPPTV